MYEWVIRRAVKSDIPAIILLQEKYLFERTPPDERKRGFVTLRFQPEHLEALIAQHTVLVVTDRKSIHGYVAAGSWEYFSQWAICSFMATQLDGLLINDSPISQTNSCLIGPICLEQPLRGTGISLDLYHSLLRELDQQYTFYTGFIHKTNRASLNMHLQRIGAHIMGEFMFTGRDYYIIASTIQQPKHS